MELALQHDLPIVIHTRNATDESISTVKPFAARGLKGIFHCFSGNNDQAHQIIEMGFYLGIGGVLTYKNSGLSDALHDININHMVLETDAPYLSPVPFRGKRNESSYIKNIAEKLALLKNITVEEVAEVTTANTEKIFGR
jgi:TatD DNase family protein